MAHKMRVAAMRALEEAYGTQGIEAMQSVWLDLLVKDGPRAYLDVLARYMPTEIDVDIEARRIPVVGELPPDPLEWAKRMQLPEVVDIDHETGEVIEDDGSTRH